MRILFVLAVLTSLIVNCAHQPQRSGYHRDAISPKNTPRPVVREKPPAIQTELPQEPLILVDKTSDTNLHELIKPWLGTPYKYGGASRSGTDCSGFVMNIMREYRGIQLPRSSTQSYKMGQSVSRSALEPGDIVFFGGLFGVDHNGIYVGKGTFAHASSSKGVMYEQLSSEYWAKRYKGARRY
jgi:cell wall-associated NlpC family hydrolase